MVDETDMSLEKKWFGEKQAEIVIKNLQRRNINGQYCASRKEALDAVLEMIPPGVTVARGDSVSVDQVGVMPALIKRNQNTIIDPFQFGEDGYHIHSIEERGQMERESFFADVYLVGTNAITMDGKLVNIDGIGNRVSAMVFGPKKVIAVVGVNKIVKGVDEALERIHQVAAPINAKRQYIKHHYEYLRDLPCLKTGRCIDCTHEARVCRSTVIIEGTTLRDKGRINVVLVGEELGI